MAKIFKRLEGIGNDCDNLVSWVHCSCCCVCTNDSWTHAFLMNVSVNNTARWLCFLLLFYIRFMILWSFLLDHISSYGIGAELCPSLALQWSSYILLCYNDCFVCVCNHLCLIALNDKIKQYLQHESCLWFDTGAISCSSGFLADVATKLNRYLGVVKPKELRSFCVLVILTGG